MDPNEKDIQEYLNAVGLRRIDEDIQNKLREILKCGVCYEVPIDKDIKVRTCEQGHHFCTDCFKKLRHCGICRGQFHLGRNFVVEDIISQLGKPFGLTRCDLPPPTVPVPILPGMFFCLHRCGSKLRAMHMIHHLRTIHHNNLVDNVRSNPYLRKFNCKYEITFGLKQFYISSFNISDMGLVTVVIYLGSTQLIASTHMLAKFQDIQKFQCKITIKVNKCGYSNEFSVSDCDLLDYHYDRESISKSGKCLKMDLDYLRTLADDGSNIEVNFSVWKKMIMPKMRDDENGYTQMEILPEDGILFKSDRKQRRNKQRNARKRKIRQAMRVDEDIEFLKRFRGLAL